MVRTTANSSRANVWTERAYPSPQIPGFRKPQGEVRGLQRHRQCACRVSAPHFKAPAGDGEGNALCGPRGRMKKGAAVQNKLGARVILRKIYSTTAYDRATRAVSLRPTKTRHPPSRKSDIGSGTGALWLSCNTSGVPLVPIYQI